MKKIIALVALFLLLPLTAAKAQDSRGYLSAVFAGGDFTAVESSFDAVEGVMQTTTGYMGEQQGNPTYQQVNNGGSGYRMAVEVLYDPKVVSYKELLDTYWHIIDPLDQAGQFCNRGDEYLSTIYYANDAERKLALSSKAAVEAELGKKPTTRILPVSNFYRAEEFYQGFHTKDNYRYMFTRGRCHRDQRLKEVWGRDAIVEKD